jgi:hypothetical protein
MSANGTSFRRIQIDEIAHGAPQIYFAAAGVYSGWLEAGPTVR